uniref:U6 small nuclear RNA (adenine-(43)-N(6))-methyltransferase n=1 Tax=Macrostomum lignano TaxID=282301 RepID=A0A1I8HY98_9PLAT
TQLQSQAAQPAAMSMNRFMHHRNRYRREKPDFAQLARDNPSFAAACQLDDRGRVVVNFKLPHQLAALTRALLERDFQLRVELPLDRLIPTLPLRLNYLHWLEDILGVDCSAPRPPAALFAASTSALAAAASTRFWWSAATPAGATEVDKRNAAYAEENVARNGLQDRVRVALAPADAGPLEFPLSLAEPQEQFDFCMCNPPFFADAAEAQGLLNTRSDSRHPPMSASTAASVESFSSGGEVMFVSRIAQESSRHRDRCRVFTSMLGRKPSLKPLKRLLERLGVASYGTYEFCQGRVMRWGIGWTFQSGVSFPMSEFKRRKLQSRPPLTMQLPQRPAGEAGQPSPDYSLDSVFAWCKRVLKRRLRIDCWDQLNKQGAAGRRLRLSAKEVTWTRQRHRRRHPAAGADKGDAANRSQESELSESDSIRGQGVSRLSDDVIGGQGDKDCDVAKGQKDNKGHDSADGQ